MIFFCYNLNIIILFRDSADFVPLLFARLLSFVLYNHGRFSHLAGNLLYSQVVSEYKNRGLDFVLEAINHPSYLEDLTGLTELQKSAASFELDWDLDKDNEDEDDYFEI